MVSFEKAKEIVEKLNSGKFGLLSLAKEYGIPPKEIVKLPKFVKEKEKEIKLKKELELEQRKELLIAEIEHRIYILKDNLEDLKEGGEGGCDLARKCRAYIRALEDIIEKVKKCKDEKELNDLEILAYCYFSGMKFIYNTIIGDLTDPEIILKKWKKL